MNRADAVYCFGGFELQPRERRLLCEARPVPLPGKAFDLLVCLVSRAPRLVRKDELLTVVWPDTVVEETNLNYTISLIRKALLDGRGGQRYIETVPRQGTDSWPTSKPRRRARIAASDRRGDQAAGPTGPARAGDRSARDRAARAQAGRPGRVRHG